MIKIYSLLAVLLLTISTAFAQGIEFEHTTWQDALEKAKTENKLLFVDAYAQWCGPCKRMAKHEFTKSDVGEYYNSNFINLKLDMETPNGRTFDGMYPVSAYPTMFFLDGNGKVVQKIKGGKKGAQLIAMAKSVMESFDFSGDYKVKYDEGDRSYETVYNYVKTLNQSRKPSLAISNEYLKSDVEMSDDERFAFMVEAAVEADSKLYDQMIAQKPRAIALLGESAYNDHVKRACDNTVSKAIEYEYEDLMVEAIAKAQEGLTTGANIYSLRVKMKWSIDRRDFNSYTSSAKSLAQIYFKKDIELMKPLLDKLMNNKVNSTKLNKLVEDLAKKYNKKSKSVKSGMLYAQALMKNMDYKKATKVLEKSIKHLSKSDTNVSPLEKLKKLIESKQS